MGQDLFAGIYVGDYETARSWYERLLGAPPAFYPNDVEVVWELAEHRYLYIQVDAEHAGHGLGMFFVDDLDAFVAGAIERGIEPVARETYPGDVRKVTFQDPDGSTVAVGGAPP